MSGSAQASAGTMMVASGEAMAEEAEAAVAGAMRDWLKPMMATAVMMSPEMLRTSSLRIRGLLRSMTFWPMGRSWSDTTEAYARGIRRARVRRIHMELQLHPRGVIAPARHRHTNHHPRCSNDMPAS